MCPNDRFAPGREIDGWKLEIMIAPAIIDILFQYKLISNFL